MHTPVANAFKAFSPTVLPLAVLPGPLTFRTMCDHPLQDLLSAVVTCDVEQRCTLALGDAAGNIERMVRRDGKFICETDVLCDEDDVECTVNSGVEVAVKQSLQPCKTCSGALVEAAMVIYEGASTHRAPAPRTPRALTHYQVRDYCTTLSGNNATQTSQKTATRIKIKHGNGRMGVVNQMSLVMCRNTHEMIRVHTMTGDIYGHLCVVLARILRSMRVRADNGEGEARHGAIAVILCMP